MIFFLSLLLVTIQHQSFLQQDDSNDFWKETQADYDVSVYLSYPQTEDKYRMEDYEPSGKSSPENDYLLVQYQVYIDSLYDTYYVQPVNSSNFTTGEASESL